MSYFGQIVRDHRTGMNLTQSALAELVGCTNTYIAKIEAGDTYPTESLATKIAAQIGWGDDLPEFLSYGGIYDEKVLQERARNDENISLLIRGLAVGYYSGLDAKEMLDFFYTKGRGSTQQ